MNNKTTKEYNNTTITRLITTKNTIECSRVAVMSRIPCDPLQVLYHHKHNTLYVVYTKIENKTKILS